MIRNNCFLIYQSRTKALFKKKGLSHKQFTLAMIDELMKEAIYYSLNPEEEKNMNLETSSPSKRILVHDENDEESQAFFTTCTTRSKRRLVLNAQPTSISTAQGMFSVTDKIGSPVSQLTM